MTCLFSSLLRAVERVQVGGLDFDEIKPIDWRHQIFVRSQGTQLNRELNGKKQKFEHRRNQHQPSYIFLSYF